MTAPRGGVRGWARSLAGEGIKNRIQRPRDELWDRRLRIKTFGYIPAVGEPDNAAWQGHYQPTAYADFFAMMKRIDLGPQDVYVDLGCGLGRTVIAAKWLGVRRAVGVEVNSSLVRASRENAAGCRGGPAGIEFVEGYAQDYPHRDTTVLFLFHPFGRGTLQTVLEALARAVHAAPRGLRIVYFNAVSDDVLAASGFLRRIDRWEAGVQWNPSTDPYPASFWEVG